MSAPEVTDYSKRDSWAYLGIGEGKDADVFLLAPTVYTGAEDNMSLSDERERERFYGALQMQRGLYEDRCRLFAPYYQQSALKAFTSDWEVRRRCISVAYRDVSASFRYFLDNLDEGRPLILAGFSQGAHMCYRLIEEYFKEPALRDRLVAVYAFGWPYWVEYEGTRYPIPPAKLEDDTCVVVGFDCEDPDVEETIINPKGKLSHSINPLNWRTDDMPADASMNIGARMMRSNGEHKEDIPNFCGCYIDTERGALKVTGVDPDRYRPIVPFLPKGAYHLYDYEFFFYNLKDNVSVRIDSYMASNHDGNR